jgi:8-oxo-dGTP pyrophosphatase MutT (NUDIX family)
VTVQFQFEGEVPPARDAATVLVMRDGPRGAEVFLLRRSADVGFMGGAYVFPGGRVDPGDADPALPCDLTPEEAAARLGEPDPARALALHVAAIRECVEESGIFLARESLGDDALAALRAALTGRNAPPLARVLPPGVTLRASSLRPLDRWVTPRLESRRFDARFFVTRAPSSTEGAAHDGRETDASAWMTPADAIARALRREIVLAPPTWRVLAEAARFPRVDELLDAAPTSLAPREPVVLTEGDEIHVALPDDPAHPRAVPLADPSLPTRFRYEQGAWLPVC